MSTNEIQMTEQPFPADLQALFNELDRTDQEARQLASDLTEAQFNWQPGGGTGWSVAQCVKFHDIPYKAFRDILYTWVRFLQPSIVHRRGSSVAAWDRFLR